MTRLHSIIRQLPSLLPGSGGLCSPALLRYYEAATTTVSFPPAPPHLPALGQTALWLTSLVRSPRPGSPRPVRQGVINRFHPTPVFGPQGTCGSPKFPENPKVAMPCSRTPVEPRCLAFTAPRCCPPLRNAEGLDDHERFRSSITRPEHWLFTLRAAITDDDAKLASGDGQSFPGGIPRYPLSSVGKFPPFGFPFPWASLGASRYPAVTSP